MGPFKDIGALRAFLAGRIDLTQAEAVLGVIDARGRDELDTALAQLAGGLATPLARLRGDLLDMLARPGSRTRFRRRGHQIHLPRRIARAACGRRKRGSASLCSPTTAHSPSNGRTCCPCGLVLKILHANLSAYDAQYVALAESAKRLLDHRRRTGQTQRCSTMQGRSLRRAHLTGGVRGRPRVAGGAGGASNPRRRIMRSTAPCTERTCCTNDAGQSLCGATRTLPPIWSARRSFLSI